MRPIRFLLASTILAGLIAAGCNGDPTTGKAGTSSAQEAAVAATGGVSEMATSVTQQRRDVRVGEPELVSSYVRERTNYDWLPTRVVIGWGGAVTVVWYRPAANADGGFRAGRLMASSRGPGGTWSAPEAVSFPYDMNEQSWDVDAGGGDSVTLVFTAARNGVRTVFESHKSSGGWSEPVPLGPGSSPRVAVDGAGRASAIWTREGVVLGSRTAAGTWTQTHIPIQAPPDFGPPVAGSDIAVNRAGATVAMWSQFVGSAPYGYAVYRAAGSTSWGSPEPLAGDAFDDSGPGLTVNRAGDVLAVWAELERVVWAHRDAGTGAWSPLARVPGRTGTIEDYGHAAAVVNPRGRGLFHWAAESGSYVARSRPGVADKAVRLQDGKRFFDAVGDPLLAHDGTAMMAGTSYGTQTRRVALLRQRPGNQWETLARPDVVHDVWSTGTRGDRMGIAYTNPRGLQVVLAKVK